LAYITDRLIAMGFPSEGREGIIRNPMNKVLQFFEERHANHYKVYNLCSERTYKTVAFRAPVAHFGFDDHNPPTLELLDTICKVRGIVNYSKVAEKFPPIFRMLLNGWSLMLEMLLLCIARFAKKKKKKSLKAFFNCGHFAGWKGSHGNCDLCLFVSSIHGQGRDLAEGAGFFCRASHSQQKGCDDCVADSMGALLLSCKERGLLFCYCCFFFLNS
jgi:hypothetical protein